MTDTMEAERHPWNRGFEWADHAAPLHHLRPEQVAQFDDAGYVVVPDLIDAATIAEVRADLDVFEAEVDAFLQTREHGRFSIAESGALTVALHAVTRSAAARALLHTLSGRTLDAVGVGRAWGGEQGHEGQRRS